MTVSTDIDCPVSFTQAALEEIKRIKETDTPPPGQALRIGVKGGGCSGLSYVLAFDDTTEKDSLYQIDGVDIVLDRTHLMYVAGMLVDFGNGLNARGFTFQNPNAKETCGCGTSFSA